MAQYYYRRVSFGPAFSGSSMVTKIVVANFVAFLLEYIFAPGFMHLFALSPWLVIHRFYLWQLFTYMFLHFGLWHLLINMFIVWMFGSTLESVWGSRKFLRYYLACGLGGAVFSFLFAYNAQTLGASAAGFGLLLAYAMLFPDNLIYIWFLFPVKAKHLVLFLAALELVQGVSGPKGVGGIAYFAHLGGMVAGLVFFRQEIGRFRPFRRFGRWWRNYNYRRRSRWEQQQRAKVDSILDKIASKGYENLSPTEKRILENYSRRQKEDNP